jgi:hypothetical protein
VETESLAAVLPARTVIYLTGDLNDHRDDLSRFKAYVRARDWQVVTVRTDLDETRFAWLRMGLLSAITIVCHGGADGVVMPEPVLSTLSRGDRTWLRNRLERYGGFLHTIPSANDDHAEEPT